LHAEQGLIADLVLQGRSSLHSVKVFIVCLVLGHKWRP